VAWINALLFLVHVSVRRISLSYIVSVAVLADAWSSSSPSPSAKRSLSPEAASAPTPSVSEQQPAKRQKLVQDAEYKKRGQRMFGVLMGTLNKFREEGSKQTDAVSVSFPFPSLATTAFL
jgi:hypothetical protein